MFALNIRSIFGDTIDCRINGKPKRVTWRDEHTLVIEPDPYATAPVDTDKFGASWTGLEALASQLRGTARKRDLRGRPRRHARRLRYLMVAAGSRPRVCGPDKADAMVAAIGGVKH
jgi:hypothetical protein